MTFNLLARLCSGTGCYIHGGGAYGTVVGVGMTRNFSRQALPPSMKESVPSVGAILTGITVTRFHRSCQKYSQMMPIYANDSFGGIVNCRSRSTAHNYCAYIFRSKIFQILLPITLHSTKAPGPDILLSCTSNYHRVAQTSASQSRTANQPLLILLSRFNS